MARKLGIDYFYKTREEKIQNFHNKNQDILDNGLINPYSNYRQINLEEYYKVLFGRNEKFLNEQFSNIKIEDLELPFEEEIGKSQIENKYIYNSILIDLKKDMNRKSLNWVITKSLKELNNVKNKDFVITAPVTYIGRNRNNSNSRYLYAITIDLDYVGYEELRDFFHQIERHLIPVPNLITNSGNGLHITYLLKYPYSLYKRTKEILNIQKEILTKAIWNDYTSRAQTRQFQNILQGYRVPETKTKLGTTVTTFLNLNSKYWTIPELNDFLNKRTQGGKGLDSSLEKELEGINSGLIKYSSRLKEAKERWPEWYQDRVIDKNPREYMQYHEGLYKWWLNICKNKDENNKIEVGHRYFCALALVAFATKCKIPKKQVKKDLYSLLPIFEDLTKEEENHFEKNDFNDALKIYGSDKAYKFKREYISNQCGIKIPKRKRNGRTREQHLKLLHATNRIKKELGIPVTRKLSTKKSPVQDKIREYLKNNPKKKPLKEIAEELGISFITLKKNYKKIKIEIEKEKISETDLLDLNKNELVLYNLLKENRNLTRKELSEISGISYNTILKYYKKIKDLLDSELDLSVDL